MFESALFQEQQHKQKVRGRVGASVSWLSSVRPNARLLTATFSWHDVLPCASHHLECRMSRTCSMKRVDPPPRQLSPISLPCDANIRSHSQRSEDTGHRRGLIVAPSSCVDIVQRATQRPPRTPPRTRTHVEIPRCVGYGRKRARDRNFARKSAATAAPANRLFLTRKGG